MNRTLIAASLLAGIIAGQAAQAAPAERPTVYSSRPRFKIPFKFDPADLQAIGARQIILYQSSDRGTTWQQVQSVAPTANRFSFEAPQDGEYWFVVRTLDQNNRLLPDARVVEPELLVVVDTVKPRLTLNLQESSAGRVLLRWTVDETNFDPTQLKLEYTQPGQDAWQSVTIVPKASGQTEWTVPGNGTVSVRGFAGDLARNTTQDQVSLRVTNAREASPAPDFSEPVARDKADQRALLPAPGQDPPRFVPAVRPGDPFHGEFASHQMPMLSPARESRPVLSERRTRAVATTDFTIGYSIEDAGPSGVSRVELYATQDNGRSWIRFAEDDDAESPIAVRMPREGTYGFAFVVHSGVGLAADPPQPGDKPEIIVAVDQTRPKIELLPLQQGRGANLNKVLIQWTYEDDHPAEKPVAIAYAVNPQGPWQTISDWTENTGRFVWQFGPATPSRFYVRIEARDEAGNTSLAESADPVVIDLSRPSARVLDIRPSQP